MESKEKRKRKISVLTIFLWLALVITMSVVVVSGTNKSNALEENEVESRIVTLKIDLTDVINDEGITEQEEIEKFLEEYAKNILSIVVYKGSEKNTIGVYELSNPSTIRIEGTTEYYDFLYGSELLNSENRAGRIFYRKELVENIDEYNFVVRKKDTKVVTVKIDFSELIDNKGITEQSEIENYLRDYSSRILGRKEYDSSGDIAYTSQYFNLKVKYIGSENIKIGVYEAEITNDVKYIQTSRLWDVQYIEISTLEYDMSSDVGMLEIGGNYINGYMNPSMSPCVYVQKILEEVDEYNISVEKKEEITINVSDEITRVEILDNTNKVAQKAKIENGKFTVKLAKGAEYDIVFIPEKDVYERTKYRGVYEDGNELNQRVLLSPSYNEEGNYYYKTIKQGENKSEYDFTTDGQLESSILWEDSKHAKLHLKLNEDWKYYLQYTKYDGSLYEKKREYDNKYIIFIEKLDENFKVAEEYENDLKWLMVNEEEIKDTKFEIPEYAKKYLKLNLENNEYIPEYVYASFFEHNFNDFNNLRDGGYIKSNEKIYNIYIKDKNMLYCLIPIDKANQEIFINLEYRGAEYQNSNIFNFNTKSIYLYNCANDCLNMFEQPYIVSTLIDKQIKYDKNIKTRIIINKSIENKEENKTYYVGLFDNENESNTDKIYNIDIVNGVGNTKIEFYGYDESKRYFVYEVDENGNKIENENLIYNKNKVLENPNKKDEYNILSDKNIISSVYSISANEGCFGAVGSEDDPRDYTTELRKITEDIGKGKGEEYYKDNSLITTEVYEDIVTISENNEKPYLVRYETKKGGKLEGSLEEVVIEGNKPVNIPSIIANDGYEFDKWVVIKDGEEIEVNPSEYVILEDTIFIAKYKEIKIEENRDTSDINVWLYVGIAIISIIAIVIVVMIMKINKKRKTLEKR